MNVLFLLIFSIVPNDHIPEPKFGAGYPVVWSDGSRGVVVQRLDYEESEGWYYLIRMKYMDWKLPEKGLKLND